MFDFSYVLEMLKVEPGHGLIQTILLAMIWWSSKGVRKEISLLHESFNGMQTEHEKRFVKIEGRITVLENVKGEKNG